MKLSALVAAAYVEVQRSTGVKPNIRSRLNRLLRRPIEAEFKALAHFKVPPGMVVIDAGANRGETIASTRLYLPKAPIIGFEPNPILCDLIRARHGHDRHFTLKPAGLGDEAGGFDLHVPYYKGVPFDGLASFRREEAASWLNGERLAGFDARHQEIRTFNCRVARLDTYHLKPAFLKIDVQGLEAAVIRGGLETIRTHLPVVLMENNRPEADARDLLRLGYVPHAYRDEKLTVGAYGALNTFYLHPETRDRFDAAVFAD